MSLFRPQALAALRRWSEPAAALGAGLVALWLTRLGGLILAPLGLALGVVALGWLVVALRKLRFAREITAPGLVEVDEGQVGYFSATFGGVLPLADLTELRLTRMGGTAAWRLRSRDGQVLTIPTEANGAPALFDAFATLPGIDMGKVSAALARGEQGVVWALSRASVSRLPA